jgi:type III restriction enzyme
MGRLPLKDDRTACAIGPGYPAAAAGGQVTPETARLLQHWRHHKFSGIRPFFCQVEAVETAIWLTEVAPQARQAATASSGAPGERQQRRQSRADAPGAEAGHRRRQDHVMAMLIAWQTVNAVRHPGSKLHPRLS